MCSLITKKEIENLEFSPAKSNSARFWQGKLEKMINENRNDEEINISFTTKGGSYRVKTKIIAVIENYVRISEDVVIPLSSVNKIYLNTPPPVILEDNSNTLFKIIILILVCSILLFILLYIFV